MAELPDKVRRYLAAVAGRVVDVYGADLVGVYTTGSLALGGFQPGRSDIDLAAVVDGTADVSRRHVLAERLDHRVLPCPAAGLEFVLYPRETVASAEPIAGYLLNLNTGAQLPPVASVDPTGSPAFWYVIDRAVTWQSGCAITGPEAREVFRPLPFERLLPLVIEAVAAHARPEEGHLLDNAVLNGCRALRFGEDRWWYTKLEAGRQTLPTAGEFAPLIQTAIATWQRGRQAGSVLPADGVQAFLAYVLAALRARGGGSGGPS